MRLLRFRVIAGLISGTAIMAGALVAATPASASPVLTPPPSSFDTCKTVGNGVICDGSTSLTYAIGDSGIWCASGTVDILDGPGASSLHDTSFYNADGNLTESIFDVHSVSQYSNPLTGAVVPYQQHQTIHNVFPVPGDPSTVTSTITGQNNFEVPGMGEVFLQAGRVTTLNNDSTISFAAGHDGVFDYFFEGNSAVIAKLCAALGSTS